MSCVIFVCVVFLQFNGKQWRRLCVTPDCKKESQRRGLCALHMGGRPRAKKPVSYKTTEVPVIEAGKDDDVCEKGRDEEDVAAASILVEMSLKKKHSTSSSCSDVSSASDLGCASFTQGRPKKSGFVPYFDALQQGSSFSSFLPTALSLPVALKGDSRCNLHELIRTGAYHGEIAASLGVGPCFPYVGLFSSPAWLAYRRLYFQSSSLIPPMQQWE